MRLTNVGSIQGIGVAEDCNTGADRFEGILEDLHRAVEEGYKNGFK